MLPKLRPFSRIKPKYSPKPTAEEMRHRHRVQLLDCFGCGVSGKSEAHHTLLKFEEKRWRRDHRFLIPLCPSCHTGRYGVHGLGSEALWCERNGKDTEAECKRLWAISEEREAQRRAA